MTEHENGSRKEEGVTSWETQRAEGEFEAMIRPEGQGNAPYPAPATPGAQPASTLPWVLFSATFVLLIGAIVLAYMGIIGQKDRMAEAVATVDGGTITKEDVYNILYQQFGKDAIEKLIADRVVENKAKAGNVTVSDAELNAEIERIKKNFPSEAEFSNQLKQAGVTIDDVKKDLRSTLYLRKLLEKGNPITEDSLKKYFQENKASLDTPEQRRASHILVKTKEEAQAVKKRLDKGEDFATVAKEKSIDPSAQNGGDLGLFGRGQMVKPFEDVAFKLEVNQVSGVVQTEYGFHIIKVAEKIAGKSFTFEEKKEEVRVALQQQLVQEKSQEYIEKIKKEAKIENFATKKE